MLRAKVHDYQIQNKVMNENSGQRHSDKIEMILRFNKDLWIIK